MAEADSGMWLPFQTLDLNLSFTMAVLNINSGIFMQKVP